VPGLVKFAPALFVVLWSTGFVMARYGTRDTGPFTFLAIRFAIAAAVLWAVAGATRAPTINRAQLGWAAVSAIGLHVLYLGGVFFAISRGLPSGLSALIAGLHPVVTSVFGRWLLQERLSRRQWAGVGLGMTGVLAVVADRLQASNGGVTTAALVAMAISVAGMAAGTLVQRARGSAMPLLRGTAMQYTTAAMILAIGATVHEHWAIRSTLQLWLTITYGVIVLSIVAVLIMLALLQRQAAAQVSSLFFLTPALSTIEGAVLFGERLGPLAVVGLVIALIGVFLTTRS
jgi:drug/metabolite transporter (DMT)-like permease